MKRTLNTLALGLLIAIATTSIAVADNIVINGSFEDAAVAKSAQWNIFDSIPGWNLARGPAIELQRGVNGWSAEDGAQWIELDADSEGPSGSIHGEDASSAIYQDLATDVGASYTLTFAFSPRPGVADNALEIVWGGNVIDTLVADGCGQSDTVWQSCSYTVTALSDNTRLEFGDRSASDSLGTLLDNVQVNTVPEPASVGLLLLGLLSVSRRHAA